MTTLETLKAARKKIEKPENWTQKLYARKANGGLASYDAPDAVCWCAEGALFAVGDSGGSFSALQAVVPAPYSIIGFNDTPGRTHSEVLRAFDEAIKKLEVA